MIDERGFYVQDKLTAEQQAAILAGTWMPGEPVGPKPGELRETIVKDRVGRPISTFEGDKGVWMNQFKSPMFRQVRINKEAKGFAS